MEVRKKEAGQNVAQFPTINNISRVCLVALAAIFILSAVLIPLSFTPYLPAYCFSVGIGGCSLSPVLASLVYFLNGHPKREAPVTTAPSLKETIVTTAPSLNGAIKTDVPSSTSDKKEQEETSDKAESLFLTPITISQGIPASIPTGLTEFSMTGSTFEDNVDGIEGILDISYANTELGFAFIVDGTGHGNPNMKPSLHEHFFKFTEHYTKEFWIKFIPPQMTLVKYLQDLAL